MCIIMDMTSNEAKVYEFLEKLDIKYEKTEHPAAETMEDCETINALLDVKMCKNLFLCNQQKTKFYLVMLPMEKRFSSKDFAKKTGLSRLSFASDEYLERYLGVRPGAVSVMGLINDTENNVTVFIDSETASREFIGCHPCVNTASMKIKTSDIFEKFFPAVYHSATVMEI